MKSHPYEYKVMVEYVSPEEAGRYPHFTRVEDQEGLSKTLEDIFKHLPAAVPGGGMLFLMISPYREIP